MSDKNSGDELPLEITPNDDVIAPDLVAAALDPEDDETPVVPVVQPVTEKFESFADANLDQRVLDVVKAQGWSSPTPVQSLCLPFTLLGRDVAGFAQTGTGKTGVFLITVAQRWLKADRSAGKDGSAHPLSVVLVPTRELAMQIHGDAEPIFDALGITSLAVFGGIDYEKQATQLRGNIDVIFATPGRLKDFFQKKIIQLDRCEIFVCDEADRMFDMGFIEDVEFFLDKLPEETQKLLFSATTNDQVKELAFEYLNKPEYISVNPEVLTPELIDQHAIICDAPNKLRVMLGLLREHNPECSIVFTNTKLTADWLHHKLTGNGIDADLITGDLPQNKRINLIQKIKQGKIRALIATDVASRGLHISRVTHVYNFDLPDDASNYVHRIGRTARAGARGSAYSLVCEDYGDNLVKINEMLGPTHALKTEWFKQDYLSIEDKASNPFEGRNRSDRGHESRDNNTGGRRDHSRPQGQQGASRHGGRGKPHDRNARPNNAGHQDRHGGGGQHRRHDTHKRDQHHGGGQHGYKKPAHQQRPHSSTPTNLPATTSSKQSLSVFAMLKKMLAAIFGKQSK